MKLRTEIRKQKVTNLEFAKTKYYKTFNIDTAGALNAANNKAMYEIYDLCEKLKFPISYQGIENIINCTGDYVKNRGLILISNGGKELHHILHRLMVHQIQINSISDGWLFFKRNSTNGRLDTNLTSLPSYLRKFIISDETLYNLDIKNSQPYFLSVLIKNDNKINPEELLRYTQIVTKGDFYEYLRDEYYNTFKINKERSQMKSMIFKIYYSKVTSYAKDKGFFRSLFPTIMDYIDRTNAECNSKLANSLSTMESFTILDKVMVDLQSKGINPFTIHDSFIVTEKELPIVKQTFIRIVGELHGILPMLHEEELFDIVDDFESEIEENYDWVIDELED